MFPSILFVVRNFLIYIFVTPFPIALGLNIGTQQKGAVRKEVKETGFKSLHMPLNSFGSQNK